MIRRWSPPAALVVAPRGLAVMLLAVVAMWAMIGGETVTCEGTVDRWTCARASRSWVWGAVGLGADATEGPEGVALVEVARRRGYAATVHYRDGRRFRLPRHPTREAAERDRATFTAWVRHPDEPLVLTGPPETRYLVVAGALTALTAAALAASLAARRGSTT